MSESANNKPIHVLRRRGVKVSIFENRSENTPFHKFTIQKIYRDQAGAWQTTYALGRDDAPIAAMLLNRAWEWVLDREVEGTESRSGDRNHGRLQVSSDGECISTLRGECISTSHGECITTSHSSGKRTSTSQSSNDSGSENSPLA